jgi:hypothetical protein
MRLNRSAEVSRSNLVSTDINEQFGTILQAGRSRVRNPMGLMIFFSFPYPSNRTRPLKFTRPLTEMNTRNRENVSGE